MIKEHRQVDGHQLLRRKLMMKTTGPAARSALALIIANVGLSLGNKGEAFKCLELTSGTKEPVAA